MSANAEAPRLAVCKAFYATNSLGLACLIPFLPLLYAAWGLDGARIGRMGAIRPLVGFVFAPLWSAAADATRAHGRVHAFCLLAQALAYGNLRRTSHAWPGIWFYVAFAEILSSPNNALADAATGSMVRRYNRARGLREGDPAAESYGRQRLWGAVSWGFIAAPIMGIIMSKSSESVRERAPFVGWFVFLCVAAALSTQLEHKHPDEDVTTPAKEEELGEANANGEFARVASAEDLHAPRAESIPRRLWAIVSQPAVGLKFFLFLMAGASMAITDIYLFLWLDVCGGTPMLMGIALFCTCVTEVVIFYNGARIKQALSLDWCLILTPFAYSVRQVYYWMLPSLGSPWAVLPVQFLHGVTFGLYWNTANDFVHEIAPKGLTASMMGVFSAVNSAGSLAGSLLGGIAYDAFGGGRLFLGIGLINLALGAFFTAHKLRSERGDFNSARYVRLENPAST